MKRTRALTQAAVISLAFAGLSASALPLNGTMSGVVSSVSPATGPLTRTVVGDAATHMMTVRWECGQPSPCAMTAPQVELAPQTVLLVPPAGSPTPALYFVLTTNPDCVARYGSSARIGAWVNGAGSATVQQCFVPTQLRFTQRPNLPPIHMNPVPVPANIRELARNAQIQPQVRLPPGSRVPPTP